MEHLLGSRSNDSDRSEGLGEREGAEEFGEHDRRGVLHIDSRPNISADAIIMSDGGP